MFLLLFILFTNLWIWKIASVHLFLAGLLILTSYILYKSFTTGTRHSIPLLLLYFLLFIFQYKTTSIQSLSSVTKNEELVQIQRVKEYPPTYIQLGYKTLWIPAAHRLEEREETIILRHIKENIFEVLDPNLYFFANHPRERVGYTEFEKFPYILLPFFLYGIVTLYKKQKAIVVAVSLIPLILLSLIGSNNPFGPFLFFPLILCASVKGIEEIVVLFKKYKFKTYLTLGFFCMYLIVVVQIISYALY